MHDTSHKPEEHGPGYSQEDWDEVSDNPKLTTEELASMQPASEVPEVYALLPKRGRGRPKLTDAKVNFTMRIAPDLLEAYRVTGDGWQVRMHEDLQAGMDRRIQEMLDRSRRVVPLSRPDKQTA
ncbi:BrnA antitoxin family protein [Methylobacterium sp. E-046]|uniref:BrnA antitoxin family protein n=1 Tax=Methylobacterium sp. E-046 TaxID=2836576 RepID=UPI001FB8A6D0|nr:BrnA antitoxin family protein [Methylobacterium sp. E-046]MCJ2098625.1 BrnA antitoxin family protein [Methylobacterium sp. E-046]